MDSSPKKNQTTAIHVHICRADGRILPIPHLNKQHVVICTLLRGGILMDYLLSPQFIFGTEVQIITHYVSFRLSKANDWCLNYITYRTKL